MPQLAPSPWFAALVFSWLILLTIVPTIVMEHKFPNQPSTPEASEMPLKPKWNWPWH
uniref:ATP synthase F0 subunit 8 n=1 Tax=Serranus papilionaceus TaxID=2800996 RepID=UPI0020277371|nr:ATP synthase F0 subunit 8 [Serranus papilionaceus]YP_010385288.1 ATP synthase F0 subunit 8 [Serranus scriba]UPM51976.1 ATP synthase F0 subunit 8 [Serranus papilionaceus]UPM51989.1 ATP synthase F0 subunit 8 [Serranus scriba]